MQWQGIRRDLSATADGAYIVIGSDMRIEGELRRRAGMELAVVQSGVVLTSMWSTVSGRFAVFSTTTGTIEAEAV